MRADEAGPHIDAGRLYDALGWAHERYHCCDVCASDCRVDRHAGGRGLCGLGAGGRVYKEYLHLGEERCLIPSHTIYLTGCNFRCIFCSDWSRVEHAASHGRALHPAELAARIALRRGQGARNINFVGGLPDVNLLFILDTLTHCPPDTHVVWNTNLWTTEETMSRLDGIVGTWLVDFKFGNDRCARELAGIRGYLARIERLLPLATRRTGVTPAFERRGAPARDAMPAWNRVAPPAPSPLAGRAPRGGGLMPAPALIVRHLLMPGHLDCCTRPVLIWMARHIPDVPVNLMTGYHPFRLAGRVGPMGAPPSEAEVRRALEYLEDAGLTQPLLDGEEYRATPRRHRP